MAEAFLKVIMDNLSSLIKHEIGLIMGVDEEMAKLSSTLTTIQAVLEDAEDKQINSKPIRDWLQKLNLLAYEIDDILDDCNTHVSKLNYDGTKLSRYSLKKILYQLKIGRRMKKVTKKLEAVAAERTHFHLREMPVDWPKEVAASRETGSLLNESDTIYGREEDTDEIVEMLVNGVREKQKMSVLPIIGVGGLGKTTLARLVFNDPRVAEHFDKRIWVCVSDDFEIKTLVNKIIESGSQKAADLQHLDAVQRGLLEVLSQERYLIVLDDVWNEQQEKWFELKDILSCGSAGSSIIVTTRLRKVAEIMGTLPSHCLRGLSDEHCWMLLRQRAFGPEEEVSAQLEIIGKQIVSKCAGVPLAAKALGGILRFKRREEEWMYVRESEIWKLSPEESLIVPALRLSYHHLPLELRQCFAYFAAFPKDYEIGKERLIQLWMAHGYISAKGTLQVEDVGNEICEELLLRSLFQCFEDRISMHDLVHDLAELVMENKVPGMQIERNITFTGTSIIREVDLVHRNVLFPKTYQQDMNISSIMELTSLRVLNASRTGIKDLPPSIVNLKHLRELNLSGTEICNLPNSLCTLWNLQILSLGGCRRLMALPKKLTSLHNLQHLYLSRCSSLCEMPPKMRELSGLKTLSVFVVGVKRGCQLEELQCLNLVGELEIRHLERVKDHLDAKKANIADKKNIRKLRLSWERNSKSGEDVDNEKVLEALEPHPNLEYLHIGGFSGRYLPRWMTNSTLGNVVGIHILDCQNCKRLPKLGELPHLKRLYLRKVGVEYIIEEEVGSGNPIKIQFPTLVDLYLYELPNLKGLSKDQESTKAFPNLMRLEISGCPTLILPPLSSLRKLEYLQCSSSSLALLSEHDIPTKLSVEIEESLNCFPIEMVVKFSKLRSLTIVGAKEISIETLVKFSELFSLTIVGAKEISVTREGLEALKELTSLSLNNCKTMRCIPEGMLRHLTSLNMLDISCCGELVELPEEIKHLQNLGMIQLANLPRMACLPEALQHLSSLRSLYLFRLPELESLPDQLPSLRHLSVEDCAKVVSIPSLPNLKSLEVNKCPQLQRRCERGTGQDWHKIAHIRTLRIAYD